MLLNLQIITSALSCRQKKRFEWLQITQNDPYMRATFKLREYVKASTEDKEFGAILDSIRDAMLHMLHMLGEPPPKS